VPICSAIAWEALVLVRRIARPLLASTFIYGGIDALRRPETKAPSAQKLDIPSKPGMQRLNITTTEQAVRVNAAVQVAGGTLLSLNRLPRLAALALAGSIVPTTLAGHRFWEESDPARKANHQTHFFKNASMLGGLLIASVDTEGRESLRRKTNRVSKRHQRRAAQAVSKKAAKKAAKKRADRLHELVSS
jgi:putative oxidoreductase